MNNYIRKILIDLDGVLNTYDGKYDENYIPPIKQGAFEFIKNISSNFEIKIFTTRNLLKASEWIIKNNLDKYISDVTNIKEPSYLIIDDRCINFKGDYKNLIKEINDFKVYWK